MINNKTCYLCNFTVSYTQQSDKEGKSWIIIPFYGIQKKALGFKKLPHSYQVVESGAGRRFYNSRSVLFYVYVVCVIRT